MYLCNCKGIKESQLRLFIQERRKFGNLHGDELLGRFSLETGLGTGCGKCVKDAQDVVDDCLGCTSNAQKEQLV